MGDRNSIGISVVIPTCNRPDLLYRCLSNLAQVDDVGCGWEIIVVDDSDPARKIESACVVEKFKDIKITYAKLEGRGLMAGRHCGAEMAKGRVLAFIDDDSFVSRSWLRGIEKTIDNADIALVCGPCLPEFEESPPLWLDYFWEKYGSGRWMGYLSLIDFGSTRGFLKNPYVFGCNYIIKRDIFYKAGGSHPDSYPQELLKYTGDGESALSIRVQSLGYKAYYQPECGIKHYVAKSRMTKEYFGNRAKFVGVTRSFTSYRRRNGYGASHGVKKLTMNTYIMAVKNRIKKLMNKYLKNTDAMQDMHRYVGLKYAEGIKFHRDAVNSDPVLLKYILRENFLGVNGKLP